MKVRDIFLLIAAAAILNLTGSVSHGQQRQLIIHADDAGMSHSVNLGTIEGLESGVVSSASIMVPCAWFSEFAEYARTHPEFDYGIHLTLNSEWKHYKWGPVAPREQVPSLIDERGYLWQGVPQVAANVRADEVETELRAQIERAKEFGVPLSHLDTHMGALVSRPDLVEVYARVGLDYNLPILFLRNIDSATAGAYPALAETAAEIVQALDAKKLPVLDSLAQFYGGDSHEERKDSYYRTIRELKPGVSQLIIHCGIDNEELRAITNSALRRDGDRRIFTSQETADLLKAENVQLLTWKQFREQVVSGAPTK